MRESNYVLKKHETWQCYAHCRQIDVVPCFGRFSLFWNCITSSDTWDSKQWCRSQGGNRNGPSRSWGKTTMIKYNDLQLLNMIDNGSWCFVKMVTTWLIQEDLEPGFPKTSRLPLSCQAEIPAKLTAKLNDSIHPTSREGSLPLWPTPNFPFLRDFLVGRLLSGVIKHDRSCHLPRFLGSRRLISLRRFWFSQGNTLETVTLKVCSPPLNPAPPRNCHQRAGRLVEGAASLVAYSTVAALRTDDSSATGWLMLVTMLVMLVTMMVIYGYSYSDDYI